MKTLIIAAALAASLMPPVAQAVGRSADITVYDRVQQRLLPVYLHEGRHYVAGQPGNEYEVRIRNRQLDDMLAVIAVDGVNVLSGDTADWEQGGYVLGPQQAYALNGWRKSLDRVAAFYFTALPDSYAARTGRPDHVGVIGVAVFRRKPEPPAVVLPQPAPHAAESAGPALADSASRAGAPAMAQKPARLGTGHGRSERSLVTMTGFERASSTPAEVITIYYDSHSNLVAQGVIRLPPVARPLPLPFPGRFVPDPS